MPSPTDLPSLLESLAPLRARLVEHPIHTALLDLTDLRVFVEHHVFAVWDFMSLLKALQRACTCVDPVWRPIGDAEARRLINEIVMGEESDEHGAGYISHFELYRRAMTQAGASTAAIDSVLQRVEGGDSVHLALESAPAAARQFSRATFDLVASQDLPAITAAFTLGREEVIPDMFTAFLRELDRGHVGGLPMLVDYFDRHVHLDGERHAPMAARLLATVCGSEPSRWKAAARGADIALQARIGLWDGILAAIDSRRGMPATSDDTCEASCAWD